MPMAFDFLFAMLFGWVSIRLFISPMSGGEPVEVYAAIVRAKHFPSEKSRRLPV
jgi:hypothetical protein